MTSREIAAAPTRPTKSARALTAGTKDCAAWLRLANSAANRAARDAESLTGRVLTIREQAHTRVVGTRNSAMVLLYIADFTSDNGPIRPRGRQ